MYAIRRSDGMWFAGFSTEMGPHGDVEIETWSSREADAVQLGEMEMQWNGFDTDPGVTVIHICEGV